MKLKRIDGTTIGEWPGETIRETLEAAVTKGADLRGAYLSGADLRDAILSGAHLRSAYLSGAYLSRADLSRAYLSGADLSRAYLSDADLSSTRLSGADLRSARLNWTSHDLLSEILWQQADTEARLMLAAYVGRRKAWCWAQWLHWEHPEKAWAVEVLRGWVQEGDENCPNWIRAAE